MSAVPGQPEPGSQPVGQPVPATPSTPPTPPGQPAAGSQPPASGGAAGSPQPTPAGAVTPGVKPGTPMTPKAPWTSYIKPVAWALVAIYVVVFVFVNRTIVQINFIFFKTDVALIFVLVGMTLIGAGLAIGVLVATRRRAAKKAAAPTPKTGARPAQSSPKKVGK